MPPSPHRQVNGQNRWEQPSGETTAFFLAGGPLATRLFLNASHCPGVEVLHIAPSSSSLPPSRQREGARRRSPTVAQECCTSRDFPLVTPYLPLGPDKNQHMTSCSFYLHYFSSFETTRSPLRILKGSCKESSPAPAGNAGILILCLETDACRRHRCKQNQTVPVRFLPSFPNRACSSRALSNTEESSLSLS